MRLILLTALTMTAFAANSVLNRLALIDPNIDPASYALIRLTAGAVTLGGIVWMRGQGAGVLRANIWSVMGLAIYALGFSYAYVSLDAGLGALLLFGSVQLTMFIGATLLGKRPLLMQWCGAGLGFVGLAYVLNPTTSTIDLRAAGLMILAAIGWGVYTLLGQRQHSAILAAAQSFVCASPVALIVWIGVGAPFITLTGVGLALASGVIFSGLGYLLWFSILPQLPTTTAAVAQLSVPLIAMLGGVIFLSEPLTGQFIAASGLVLGGIGLSIWAEHNR